MEIIRAGDPQKKVDKRHILTCDNCGCRFCFNINDVKYNSRFSILSDKALIIVCPWCEKDVNVANYEEE